MLNPTATVKDTRSFDTQWYLIINSCRLRFRQAKNRNMRFLRDTQGYATETLDHLVLEKQLRERKNVGLQDCPGFYLKKHMQAD